MKNWLVLFLLLFLLVGYGCGCGDKLAKEFLIDHPEISFMINKKGEIYNKYTSVRRFNGLSGQKELITFFIDNVEKEDMVLSNKWQKISGTNFMFSFHWDSRELIFKETNQEPIKEPEEKTKIEKKESTKMELTLGTWIMLIIVMVIVGRFSNKIGLKTIFRPTKKAAKTVKKEWSDS